MEKMLLVLKNEFRVVVLRKSFFLTLILVPLIGTVIFGIFGSIGGTDPTSAIGRIISSGANCTVTVLGDSNWRSEQAGTRQAP